MNISEIEEAGSLNGIGGRGTEAFSGSTTIFREGGSKYCSPFVPISLLLNMMSLNVRDCDHKSRL